MTTITLDSQTVFAEQYAQTLNRLRSEHPEIDRLLLELDSTVETYVAAATEKGIRAGLAGRGWVPAGNEITVEAAGDTMTVAEVAEAAGIEAPVWLDFAGRRLPVHGATVKDGSVVLWSDDPALEMAERIDGRLDQLDERLTRLDDDAFDRIGALEEELAELRSTLAKTREVLAGSAVAKQDRFRAPSAGAEL